jgi:hypothetical protein
MQLRMMRESARERERALSERERLRERDREMLELRGKAHIPFSSRQHREARRDCTQAFIMLDTWDTLEQQQP